MNNKKVDFKTESKDIQLKPLDIISTNQQNENINNNQKIMVITTTDNMIWQFLIPHIQELQRVGHTVECVCARTGFWFDELKNKYGFVVHEINFARNPISFKNIKGYNKLVKLQKERNYDLIYCHQPVGGFMGRLIAKKFKLPCIYVAHGFHFYKGCPLVNKLIYKTVENWASRYTTKLITMNEEDFQSAQKMKAQNVYKINGIGIDSKKMYCEEFDIQKFRKSIGLMPNDKMVLTISELNKNKNYITMLNAMKEVFDKNKDVKFISCGRGVWEQKIKNYAKKLGIEKKCIFLGYRKDVNKILRVTDVFLHASFREGLTLSVMEAMSVGIPCVVSNVRGNRDLIENGKGGFVCEVQDYQAFADRILEIISKPKMALEMSEFNQEQSKKYSIDYVKEQLNSIYKKN